MIFLQAIVHLHQLLMNQQLNRWFYNLGQVTKTTPGVLALRNLLPHLKINKPSLYDYLAADGGMVREKALA
jgi:hypothetical protein